jgi:hypothetical protein
VPERLLLATQTERNLHETQTAVVSDVQCCDCSRRPLHRKCLGDSWQPLGSTGWHTHPGHSLIIVTAGSVTEYDGNDPDCKPHVYTAIPGMSVGFVDPGGEHAHILRNESTTTVAKTMAIQLVPAGAVRRIDVAQPANCPNVQ